MSIKEGFKNISFLILAVLPAIIIYSEDLKILFDEALKTEALTHILLVPAFAAILFYLKRDTIKSILSIEKQKKDPTAKHSDVIAGLILCLTALLIYWYGSNTSRPIEYHILSIPIFLAGTILTLSNFKVLRVMLFPTLFFLFLIPPPLDILYMVSGVTANLETQASYNILQALNTPVTLSNSYGPPTLQLEANQNSTAFTVDLPCSGIYSLIAFTVFSAFLSSISKATTKRKVAMFLLGLPTFEALNIVRITTIVSIAYHLNEEAAMLIFHSLAGLTLIFIGMILTLITSEKVLGVKILPKKTRSEPCPTCNESQKRGSILCQACGRLLKTPNWKVSREAWAKATLLVVGCLLIAMSLKAPTFAIAKNTVTVLSTEPEKSANILPEIEGYNLTFLYRDTSYENLAKQDAAIIYAYYPKNDSKPTIYASINVADTLSNLHSWEVCLITWQTSRGRYPLVEVLDSKEIRLMEDPPIIARYLAFRNPNNYTQITLYWFEKAAFNNGITVQQKYVRINLIIITQEGKPKEFEEDLITMGKTVASHWEPIKTNSMISLGIPAIQATLALSAVSLILLNATKHIHKTKVQEKNVRIFMNLASDREKKILNIVEKLTEEKRNIETQEILKAFNRETEEDLNLDELTEILKNLEKHGIIERDIILIDDTLKLTWRTKSKNLKTERNDRY